MSDDPPANAKLLGRHVRRILKDLGVPAKVTCRTESFSGFGYGECAFASVDLEVELTVGEQAALRAVREWIRQLPPVEGGGACVIQLRGKHYPFGGSIN